MHVVIVGPGRLGRSLARLWADAGHTVSLVGRGDAVPSGDATLLAVPDRALASVAATLRSDEPVLHASGASDLSVLAPALRRGSLHPLMSFPGPEVALPDLRGVPAAVDASDPATLAVVTQLASDLGLTAVRVPGDRRLYHAAAVIAGNFATVLLAEAGRALAAAGVPEAEGRAMLAPLAVRSITQAVVDPAAALTGPAARGDVSVIAGHEAALRAAGLPDLADAYAILSARASALAH